MNNTSLKFGDYRLDLSPLRLWQNGREKKLPMKPLKLLAMLAQRSGELVSQDDIRRDLWPDRTIDFSKSIHVHIRQIRKILNDDADHPRYVVTEPRQGYRFVASVEQVKRPRGLATIIPSKPGIRLLLPLLATIVIAISVTALAGNRPHPFDPADSMSGNTRDAYLRGVHLLDAGNAQAALPLLAEAVLLSPDNATVLASFARAYALSGDFESARIYAETALNLDPGLASAHEAIAHVLALADWQWAQARIHLETAHRLDRDYAPALHGLATLDALAGNWENAHSRMQQARRADPTSTLLAADQGIFFFYSRDFQQALSACRDALELDPQNAAAQIYAARAALYSGEYETARHHIQRYMIWLGSDEADIDQLLANQESALAAAFHVWYLGQLDPSDTSLTIYRAVYLAEIGDDDLALSLFQDAIANRDPFAPIIAFDPAFDHLRADARFQTAFAQFGL